MNEGQERIEELKVIELAEEIVDPRRIDRP